MTRDHADYYGNAHLAHVGAAGPLISWTLRFLPGQRSAATISYRALIDAQSGELLPRSIEFGKENTSFRNNWRAQSGSQRNFPKNVLARAEFNRRFAIANSRRIRSPELRPLRRTPRLDETMAARRVIQQARVMMNSFLGPAQLYRLDLILGSVWRSMQCGRRLPT
jgi:hypothetical protein